MKAAIEGFGTTLPQNSLAGHMQKGINVVTSTIEQCIDKLCEKRTLSNDGSADVQSVTQTVDDSILGNIDDEDRLVPHRSVVDRIKVYWLDSDACYPGTVAAINDGGSKYSIDYGNDSRKILNLPEEI